MARVKIKDVTPVDRHISERLRKLRESRSMTQATLGDVLGITFQQIQKYENAQNRIPASRLYHISRVLDVSIGYFFENAPDPIAPPSKDRV